MQMFGIHQRFVVMVPDRKHADSGQYSPAQSKMLDTGAPHSREHAPGESHQWRKQQVNHGSQGQNDAFCESFGHEPRRNQP